MPDEDVHGLQDLLASMEALPLALQKRLIVRALRKAAEPTRQRMSDLAPDDPRTPGSRIGKSIGIVVGEQTADGAIARIGPSKKGFAAIFAERGTRKQTAKPFMGPAFDQTVDQAYQLLGEVLGEGIEDEFYKKHA